MHLTNRNDYANMYVSPCVDTSTEYHHIFRIYYTTFSECNQADIVNFIRCRFVVHNIWTCARTRRSKKRFTESRNGSVAQAEISAVASEWYHLGVLQVNIKELNLRVEPCEGSLALCKYFPHPDVQLLCCTLECGDFFININ